MSTDHIVLTEPTWYKSYFPFTCLENNNLHVMDSSCSECLPEECVEWCDNHRECGAFVVFQRQCYFKNHSCEDERIDIRTRYPGSFPITYVWAKRGDSQFEDYLILFLFKVEFN